MNWLVFIPETGSVYYAVRAECLTVVKVILSLKRLNFYVIVRILVLRNEDSRCSWTFVPVCHTIVIWQETAVLRCIAIVTSNFSVRSFVMWDIEQFFSTVLRREGLRWTALGGGEKLQLTFARMAGFDWYFKPHILIQLVPSPLFHITPLCPWFIDFCSI